MDHLEKLFDMSVQLLCVASTDGYFKRLNPAWESTLGYSIDELLSKPFLDFVNPADREATLRELGKLADGQPTKYFENRFRCRDGSYRRLAWTSASQSDGVLCATALDITAAHDVAGLLPRLIESLPDAMVITKGDGTIHLVNRLSEQLFLCHAEDLIGKPVEILIPKHLRDKHESHRRDYVDNAWNRPMGAGLELTAVRADGVEFPVEISLGPLNAREETFVICAIRDITVRKQSEEALHSSETALQASRTALEVSETRANEQEAELFAAEKIQMRLHPKAPPDLPGYDIAGRTLAAVFTAGDMHDFLPMGDGSVGLVVGDVTGHGFGAALLMASTHAYLRALVESYPHPCDLITRVHTALRREIAPNRFVSAFLARLDFRDHTLTYVNAGHPSGYLLDVSGNIVASMDSTTWPLAMFSEIEPDEIGPIRLQEGHLTLLMTDGLLEARSPAGEFFGLDRVLEVSREHQRAPAAEILDAIYLAVHEFTGRKRPEDDITVVVLKRLDEPK